MDFVFSPINFRRGIFPPEQLSIGEKWMVKSRLVEISSALINSEAFKAWKLFGALDEVEESCTHKRHNNLIRGVSRAMKSRQKKGKIEFLFRWNLIFHPLLWFTAFLANIEARWLIVRRRTANKQIDKLDASGFYEIFQPIPRVSRYPDNVLRDMHFLSFLW